MLKIIDFERFSGGLLLRVEGALIGQWASELKRLCDRFFREQQLITLDLEDVRSADAYGINVLIQLIEEHVRIGRCSLFLQLLLNDGLNR